MKTTQYRNRLRIAIAVSFTMILGELASDLAFSQDNTTTTNNNYALSIRQRNNMTIHNRRIQLS